MKTKLEKLLSVTRNVESISPRNYWICIQYKTTCISFFRFLPSFLCAGVFIGLFMPVNIKGVYKFNGFSLNCIPPLKGPVMQWPSLYRWVWRKGILKSKNLKGGDV